jgi:hypothetical protein
MEDKKDDRKSKTIAGSRPAGSLPSDWFSTPAHQTPTALANHTFSASSPQQQLLHHPRPQIQVHCFKNSDGIPLLSFFTTCH